MTLGNYPHGLDADSLDEDFENSQVDGDFSALIPANLRPVQLRSGGQVVDRELLTQSNRPQNWTRVWDDELFQVRYALLIVRMLLGHCWSTLCQELGRIERYA